MHRRLARGRFLLGSAWALGSLVACASLPVAPLDPPEGDDASADGATATDGSSTDAADAADADAATD